MFSSIRRHLKKIVPKLMVFSLIFLSCERKTTITDYSIKRNSNPQTANDPNSNPPPSGQGATIAAEVAEYAAICGGIVCDDALQVQLESFIILH